MTVEGTHPEVADRVDQAQTAFAEAMASDLNTAGALGAMFELVRALNSAIDTGQLGRGDLPIVRTAFDDVRPGARRAVAAPVRRRAAAGAG